MPMKNLRKTFLVIAITITTAALVGGGLAAGAVNLLKGQTIYLPCYSTIRGIHGENIAMIANLFVHNVDPQNSINIVRVDLYDADGKLVEKYLPQPMKIGPLAATRFSLKPAFKGDGGEEANFVVQWRADTKVIEPLIETVFVGAIGTHGYSFSSLGRVMAEETD